MAVVVGIGVRVGEEIRKALEAKQRIMRSKVEIKEEEVQDTAWEADKRGFKNQILQKLGLLPSEVTARRLGELGLVARVGYWFNSVEYDNEPAFFDKVVANLTERIVVYHFEAYAPYAIVLLIRDEAQWDCMYGLDGADALRRCFRRGALAKVEDFL